MGSRHRDISRTVVLLASLLAQKKTCLLFSLFALLVRPLAKKISCEGSLSLRLLCKGRGRCPKRSGFSYFFGGDGFRLTEILLQSYAASHHLIVSSFIRDLVFDQLEEDGELEEARILKKHWNFPYKEVYDLEEML